MAATRRWYHWSIVIPLAALLSCAVGWCVERRSTPRELEIQVAPSPSSDLPALVLPPRARELEATLLAADETPIDEALVWLVAGDEPHWTVTNAQGRFRFEDLQRGPWTLYVVAHRHEPFQTTISDSEEARTIHLPDAARAAPSLPSVARVDLSGHVDAPTNAKLEGCEVSLVPAASMDTLGAPIPRRALVDASGAFAFDALIAGDYRVRLLPSWAAGGSWPDLAKDSSAPLARLVSVHPGDADELVVRYLAGAVRGRLVERDGTPLEGGLVLVHQEGGADHPWPPIASDARGEFVRDDLPPGRYVVRVRAGAAVETRAVEIRERETAFIDFPPLATAKPRAVEPK